MKPLTAEEIAELRRLQTVGTGGAWTAGDDGELHVDGYSLLSAGPGAGWSFGLKADADWTAAARDALPRLLDEVERLRDLCGRAADELRGDRIEGTWDEMVDELEAAAGRKP